MLEIAVLITVHNRKAKTMACLEHLFAAELPEQHSLEVFLVDDGSSDGTGEAVKANYPTVNVIQGNGNLYWNRGMHLAWETAAQTKDFDFYLWLNDDTIVLSDSIKTLILDSDSLNHRSIVCGATISSDHEQYTYGGRTKKRGLIEPNGLPQTCETINGNCVLVPQAVYKKVGFNDPVFHHTIGDHDYSLRAAEKGIQSYVASKAIGICDNHEKLPAWCLPYTPLLKRFKSLYSPLGNSHPYYYFIFEKRHYGIFVAIKHLLSIHIRVLFPRLWKN